MTPENIPPVTTHVAAPDLSEADNTQLTDRAAVALSLICIVHCVALPLLAVALPFISAVSEAEWVHWVFAMLAVLASSAVVATSPSARTPTFLAPAGLGASLVAFGLIAESFGIEEAVPTVIGGVLLAFAHWRRLTA